MAGASMRRFPAWRGGRMRSSCSLYCGALGRTLIRLIRIGPFVAAPPITASFPRPWPGVCPVSGRMRPRSLARLVSKMLGAKRFVDVGIPGTTLAQGYDTELSGALAARPVLCTVFFGVNDLRAGVPLKRFLSDLYSLVVTLRRAHVRVLIIGMPDLSSLPVVRRVHIVGVAAVVHAWNAGMARVARRAGARFLDLQSFTRELAAHPNYVAPDGLHPSNAGHQRLAQVVVAAIRRDGLWRRP